MGVQVVSDDKKEKVLKRASSQNRIARSMELLKNNGIYVVCDSIFGFPDETEEELLQLASFYNENPPNHCENFWLRFYPKTEITEWALEKDYISPEKNELIEKGEFSFGLVRRGEVQGRANHADKIMGLLGVYPFLTKALRGLIIKKRLYRFFPPIPSLFLLVIVRIFNHPRFDFNTARTIKRYLYFCSRKALGIKAAHA
jgi:radical SAM superfamily enzyme YgiQ (UPF0313 family)